MNNAKHHIIVWEYLLDHLFNYADDCWSTVIILHLFRSLYIPSGFLSCFSLFVSQLLKCDYANLKLWGQIRISGFVTVHSVLYELPVSM